MDRSQQARMVQAVAGTRARLEAEGLFVISERLIDEGSWGRTDLSVSSESTEGGSRSGKVQIHLNKKGAISVVPQGEMARQIGQALGHAAAQHGRGRVADARSPAKLTGARPPAKLAGPRPPASDGPLANGPSVRSFSTRGLKGSASPAKPGDLVVDCSKFGESLIGPTEWQAKLLGEAKWELVHKSPLFARGHNNLGEFIAIVGALKLVAARRFSPRRVFSDSRTAISWVTKAKLKTTIDYRNDCDPEFALAVEDAVKWTQSDDCQRLLVLLVLWDTKRWGENPADFGRK